MSRVILLAAAILLLPSAASAEFFRISGGLTVDDPSDQFTNLPLTLDFELELEVQDIDAFIAGGAGVLSDVGGTITPFTLGGSAFDATNTEFALSSGDFSGVEDAFGASSGSIIFVLEDTSPGTSSGDDEFQFMFQLDGALLRDVLAGPVTLSPRTALISSSAPGVIVSPESFTGSALLEHIVPLPGLAALLALGSGLALRHRRTTAKLPPAPGGIARRV